MKVFVSRRGGLTVLIAVCIAALPMALVYRRLSAVEGHNESLLREIDDLRISVRELDNAVRETRGAMRLIATQASPDAGIPTDGASEDAADTPGLFGDVIIESAGSDDPTMTDTQDVIRDQFLPRVRECYRKAMVASPGPAQGSDMFLEISVAPNGIAKPGTVLPGKATGLSVTCAQRAAVGLKFKPHEKPAAVTLSLAFGQKR